MKPLLTLTFLLLLLCGNSARAEKADADKPTTIDADQMVYDDVRQTKTFTGNVIMRRGSILIQAGKVVLTTTPAGYEYAVLYAAPGQFASFRQKRDGGPDLWIQGHAERIEHDERTEVTKLFTKAHIQRMTGDKITDAVDGEFISYDARSEVYSVNNTDSGESKSGAGRIKAVIQPNARSTKGP